MIKVTDISNTSGPTKKGLRAAAVFRAGLTGLVLAVSMLGCSSSTVNLTGPYAIAWTPGLATYLGPKSTNYQVCYSEGRTSMAVLLANAQEHCAEPILMSQIPDKVNCSATSPMKAVFRCAPQNYYSICFSKMTAKPQDIQKMTAENCADPVLIQEITDVANCSIGAPVRVTFRCSALSRAASEMRPNMPLIGGIDGQFRF